MPFNAAGHTLATIFGQTVTSVTFSAAGTGILVVTISGGRRDLSVGAATQGTNPQRGARLKRHEAEFRAGSFKIRYCRQSPQLVPKCVCWRAHGRLRRASTIRSLTFFVSSPS